MTVAPRETQAQGEARRFATQAPAAATVTEAMELILDGRPGEAYYRLHRATRQAALRSDLDVTIGKALDNYRCARDRQSVAHMATLRVLIWHKHGLDFDGEAWMAAHLDGGA